MRSGSEIKVALERFVARWRDYDGSERAGAQSFLTQLFDCYGTDLMAVGAKFEHFEASSGFADLFWPEVLIVEMKAPTQSLAKAAEQRDRYWRASADAAADRRAVRYVIACNFRELEIWEPGWFPETPRATIALEDLPERYDALLFLQAPSLEPVFIESRRELTAEAAKHVAELYQSLADRSAAPIDEIQDFTLQAVWCLFAEDLGMLKGYPLQATVNRLLKEAEPDSARDIGHLFRVLNQKGDHNRKGAYAGTTYVNGDLFAKPAAVLLDHSELEHLRDAARFDWRQVDPTVFGSLLEGILGPERRWELGAHYTHESDIMKIVTPTIVRPWRERIGATRTPAEARALLDDLCAFTLLDPACGCGNFLYVAYRELRGLESELKDRIHRLARETGLPVPAGGTWPFYPLTNLYGLDIDQTAVNIARITLWMGHRQMIDKYGQAEDPLPLVTLSGIQAKDALFNEWPEADAIIGNPPFLGDRKIRGAFGGEYVERLKREFKVGVVDFSAYWFRRAAAHLKPGQRAGFVSTNTLRENKHRLASLDHIVDAGGVITDAVSTQQWPGDAKVHVSLTNWVHQPDVAPAEFLLDGQRVDGITSRLRAGFDGWEPRDLPANKRRSFIGCQPTGDGFILGEEEARTLLADDANVGRVRPYVTGQDIAQASDQGPRRWIIDFGIEPLEAAARTPALLDIVRRDVKPEREGKGRHFERLWWQFAWPRPEMREAISSFPRFVTSTATGKRLLLAWQDARVVPSNATVVFTFDDDYAMGVLLSRVHDAWAWARASTLKGDLRYTPSSVFETFPWPHPVDPATREAVAAASRDLYALRSRLCLEHDLGLTKLYNLMDDGAFTDLAAAHRRLDEAVVAAYGWPASIAQDPDTLVTHLTERNRQITENEVPYAPFD